MRARTHPPRSTRAPAHRAPPQPPVCPCPADPLGLHRLILNVSSSPPTPGAGRMKRKNEIKWNRPFHIPPPRAASGWLPKRFLPAHGGPEKPGQGGAQQARRRGAGSPGVGGWEGGGVGAKVPSFCCPHHPTPETLARVRGASLSCPRAQAGAGRGSSLPSRAPATPAGDHSATPHSTSCLAWTAGSAPGVTSFVHVPRRPF